MNLCAFILLALVIGIAWVIWGSQKMYDESVEDDDDDWPTFV